MMTIILRLLGSKIGIGAMAAMAVFLWHNYDKAKAVKAAISECIQQSEIDRLEGENQAMQRRIFAEANANSILATKATEATNRAVELTEEMKRYENENSVASDCRVDNNVLNRLRNK